MPGNSLKQTMDEMAKIMTNTPVILPNTETSALQTCVRAPCNDESYTCVFPCNMLPLIDGKVVPFCMCMYLLHYNITWFPPPLLMSLWCYFGTRLFVDAPLYVYGSHGPNLRLSLVPTLYSYVLKQKWKYGPKKVSIS